MNNARIDQLEREARDRQYARAQVGIALRKGAICREPCACGNDKTEAHHHDYRKPLEVVWMCRRCHTDLHKDMRQAHVLD